MIPRATPALALLFLSGLVLLSADSNLAATQDCSRNQRWDGNTGRCVACPSRPADTASEQEHLHYESICRGNPACCEPDAGAGGSAALPSPPTGVDNAAQASKKRQSNSFNDVGMGRGSGSSGNGGRRNASSGDTTVGDTGNRALLLTLLGIFAAAAITTSAVALLVCHKNKSQKHRCSMYEGVSTDPERGDNSRAASVGADNGSGSRNSGSGSDGSQGGEGGREVGGVSSSSSRPLPEPPAQSFLSVNTEETGITGANINPLVGNLPSGIYPREGTYDSLT